jgi:putative transposase
MSRGVRQVYPTDLTDAQWAGLEPLLPPRKRPRGAGRPRTVSLRRVINALLYLERTGRQWRLLPKEFPYWGTVRYYFDRWTDDGTWQRLNTALRERVRVRAGRDPRPSAAILDGQPVCEDH